MRFRLMPEVAEAGEDHGDVLFIGRGDHFGVAHRTTGLDDGLGARFGARLSAISGPDAWRNPYCSDSGITATIRSNAAASLLG